MTDINELLKQRGKQYGDAVQTHIRIAQGWSGIFNTEITPLQVALAMDYLKSIRAVNSPELADSFDDKHGYTRIAELIAGHRDSLDDNQPKLEYDKNTEQNSKGYQLTEREILELHGHDPYSHEMGQ